MSIHGNQYILPLFLNKERNEPYLEQDDELAFAFYLITRKIKPNHKILSFSRLLWPLLSIQGVISTHIILDGLKIFSKKGKLTNPPRQPLVGHILRNVDNISKIEQLERIIKVLTYEDQEAEKLGEGEDSEFQVFQIESLTNPEFLNSFMALVPHLQYKAIEGYMPLDTNMSTDKALDIAEEYRNTIETLKGNSFRWNNQIDLIGEKIEKWLIDLNVQLKDNTTRYKSEVEKISTEIDDEQVRDLLAMERDKIEQWKADEKKRLVENISVLFKTVDVNLEEMLKMNRFYSNSEILKRKSFENLIPSINNHFSDLRDSGNNILNNITTIEKNFQEIQTEAKKIESEANQRMNDFESNLRQKLQNRNIQISNINQEKNRKLQELEDIKNQIEVKFDHLKNIIKTKQQDCLNEANGLIEWSIKDNNIELFAKPIQWVYMPVYAMFVEDEDMMEEYMHIVLPGYVNENSTNLYENISEAFESLVNHINEKIEDDMIIRSNFEFSCENKNLLNVSNFDKRIQKGIALLRKKNLINDEIENTIRSLMKNLS